MTNQDQKHGVTASKAVSKKLYQTPELTVHGRVEEITKFMLLFTSHK